MFEDLGRRIGQSFSTTWSEDRVPISDHGVDSLQQALEGLRIRGQVLDEFADYEQTAVEKFIDSTDNKVLRNDGRPKLPKQTEPFYVSRKNGRRR